MFDWEHGIALLAMQGNQASSLAKGEVSWFFSNCGGNLWYILELRRGWQFKTCVCSATLRLQSSYDAYLMNLNWLDRTIRMLLQVWRESEGHFLVSAVIFWFLTIFKKSQASSTFEALNSGSLLRWQRDVRPLVQMRWRPRAFCRVSTRDSDILSSWDIKNEPAIKPLQGNQAFFCVRESRGPFHLKQKTQGPSNIHSPEGKLFLRGLWKVGLSLQSKTWNQLSSPDDTVSTEHSSCCFTEIDVPLDLSWVSQGISGYS